MSFLLTPFSRLFRPEPDDHRPFTWGDIIALLVIMALLYAGVRLALGVPEVIAGPAISLDPRVLPWYALLSLSRMAIAYALSLLFTLIYGHLAAYNRRAERVLMPLLDVLQSVPILSFLPVVLLGLSAILPEGIAAELASIVLIFTSQVWNLTLVWYQSLTTIPQELREVGSIFRLNNWLRFRRLELPFAMLGLIWNSMVSWAGGWFFLMAAEIFTVGERDFRLPGLGAYLKEAADSGNATAIAWGILTLVLLIVALDQLVWRPLLAWADRFKLEMVEGEEPPGSWFYNALRGSRLTGWLSAHIASPALRAMDTWSLRRKPQEREPSRAASGRPWVTYGLTIIGGAALAYGLYRAIALLVSVPTYQWAQVGLGLGATTLRVLIALAIGLVWTIPVGVAVGTNRRLANLVQPLIQIAASVPATALFPIFFVLLLGLPAGLEIAAILLMLAGTQWYLLFNIIAGANAIPQDLKYTADLMQLTGWQRWRIVILPAMFPYLVTGAITASGGAWNASIVAEFSTYGGQTYQIVGIGALIAEATSVGDYSLLLAATLAMILAVVLINRLVWQRLYRLAEERYRME